MRDLRRDETWLADYAARKAAQRVQGRAPCSFQTQGSTSVHQRWKDREVSQSTSGPELPATAPPPPGDGGKVTGPLTQSTSGRTAVATSLPRSHDAGSPGPLTPIATCADAATGRRGTDGACTSSAAGATNKYRNVKTDGYSSRKEAKRAAELRLLLAAGEITDLREQVPYVLIPRQLDADGSVAERAVKFIADFVYRRRGEGALPFWPVVVEDCKGTRTPTYVVKRKLMRFMHGITILET